MHTAFLIDLCATAPALMPSLSNVASIVGPILTTLRAIVALNAMSFNTKFENFSLFLCNMIYF